MIPPDLTREELARSIGVFNELHVQAAVDIAAANILFGPISDPEGIPMLAEKWDTLTAEEQNRASRMVNMVCSAFLTSIAATCIVNSQDGGDDEDPEDADNPEEAAARESLFVTGMLCQDMAVAMVVSNGDKATTLYPSLAAAMRPQ